VAALLAFLSSMSWGTGDFFGGLLSRKRNAIAVVLMMQLFGLVFISGYATFTGAWVSGPYLWAGIGAGLSGTAGLMAFYRALATGTMGVVAPIAALGVMVPLAYGLMRGEQPAPLQWMGILIAVIGVMAASGPELTGQASAAPLLYACASAVLFGTAMAFMAAGASESATMTVVVMRVVQVAVAVCFWLVWRGFGGIRRSDLPTTAVVGFFDVAANLMYSAAAAIGPVSTVAVLGSFPPVATAVLGRFVLRERLTGLQYVGVALAVCGAVAISAG
jgi:drug/metabolite transporter (DMT)-like permease